MAGSSAGGEAETKVPRPRIVTSTPSFSSDAKARCTVLRLIFRSTATCRMVGNWSPGLSCPWIGTPFGRIVNIGTLYAENHTMSMPPGEGLGHESIRAVSARRNPPVQGRAFGQQRLDFGVAVTGLAQDLDAVLAEARGRIHLGRAAPAPAARGPDEVERALGRVVHAPEEADRREMRVVDQRIEVVRHHAGNVVRLEQRDPFGRGPRAQDFTQQAVDLVIVPGAGGVVGEARVGGERRVAEQAEQRLPLLVVV